MNGQSPLTKSPVRLLFFPVLLLFLSGCGTMITPKEVNLTLSGRYQDVIRLIEGREAEGRQISQRERYTLCEAYLQSSVYNKLFPCLESPPLLLGILPVDGERRLRITQATGAKKIREEQT